MQLFDRQGNPVEVPEEQVPQALASGDFGVPKEAAVPVFDPDGTVGTVTGDKLHEALAGGYALAKPEDIAKAQHAEKYGGVGGALKAGALEGLSTATLGLSDVAGSALGGADYRETRKAYREENPNATIAGGLIGAVAPIALTGGAAAPEEAVALGGAKLAAEGAEGASLLGRAGEVASGARKVLTAPTQLVERAGGAVEGAVAKALGSTEGTSLASALAKRAIAKGAGVATEGAFISAGQQLGEDALGDPDANGEKLLAALGHGALLGIGASAGLTAAGALGRAVLGRVAPAVSHMAEGQAVRSVFEGGARKAYVKELERIPGGARAAGRQMLEDGVLQIGDNLEAVAPKVAAKRAEYGQRVGAILDAADEAGIEGPRVAELRAQVEREVLAPLEKLPKTNAGAISKVKGMLSDLDAYLGIPNEVEAGAAALDREAMQQQRLTFKQAQEFRSTLGKTIEWRTNPLGPIDKANESAKDVYRLIEGSVEQSGDKAAKELGGNFLEQYQEAKLGYRRYAVLDKAASEGLAARQANRAVSPSSMGVGGAVGAGLLAHAAAGPLGFAAAAGKAIATTVAHQTLLERGNATAAVLLDKVSAMRGIERAAKRVDQQMDRSVARLFKDGSRAEPEVAKLPIGRAHPELGEASEPTPPLPGDHPYRSHAGAIVRAVQAPIRHAERIADAAAPIEQHAPQTSRAFQGAAIRATQYLASQLPHRIDRPSMTAQHDAPRLSPSEERRYMLVAHAVHDPMSVLRDLGTGTATRAQVDALRAVYPALYQELVQRVEERLESLPKGLELSQRRALRPLFGAAIDPSADPAFGARMQQDFAGAHAGPKSGPPRGGAPKRKLEGRANSLALPGSLPE